MTTMESFPENANALVIGGNRGIGQAMVAELLASGRFGGVYAAGRRGEAAHGAHGLQLDVTDEASVAAAAERLHDEGVRLHLVIYTVGVLHDGDTGLWPEKRLEDVDPAALQRAFAVNAGGVLLVAKHFHRLLANERAVLAHLSARVGSIGDNGLGGWYAYRGSKAAQNMFTRGIAVELGRRRRNAVVLALHPGTTDTGLSAPFQGRVPEGKLFSPAFVAERLLGIIDRAGTEQSGRFFAWDGAEIPW